ncbi:carboxymuconolactone decarboxylase family protein [Apibacter sp. HY039]|uniref:carboxymuconolactone decarboxylase family protein n=1 Tax=Apibacter sp. HY039 TaxID=2501476 RepID=UPI000FEB71FD|nr:carboxymuconolactone decarboxylase family protein [Apibacter sp. HY039]
MSKNKKKINITSQAIINYEELWPGYESDMLQTDPELAEIVANFAFDEILEHDKLGTKKRVLMILASTLGTNSPTEFKHFVHAALNTDTQPAEIKEILYQAVPYLGISKIIEYIYITNTIFEELEIPLPLEKRAETVSENCFEKGLALQKKIFGATIEKMYENSPADLLHIQRFLSSNCFGDFVSRGGLDLKTREMATFTFLLAMGGTENQMKGHILGNVEVGNDRAVLISLITQLIPYVGYPRALNAISCLNEILPPK